MLSSTKVFEMTASMKDPVMRGIEYTVIRSELAKRCPRLMSVHALLAVHRQPTRELTSSHCAIAKLPRELSSHALVSPELISQARVSCLMRLRTARASARSRLKTAPCQLCGWPADFSPDRQR